MKILPVATDLFRTERQADMMKQIVAFRNVAKAAKNDRAI
jgi:hypothetical protein